MDKLEPALSLFINQKMEDPMANNTGQTKIVQDYKI